MRSSAAGFLVFGLAVALLTAAGAGAQAPRTEPAAAWPGCCGLEPWAEPGPLRAKPRDTHGLFGGYGAIVGGSTLRHNLGVTGKFPAVFLNKRNPLPPTPQNAQRGAAIYKARCASCHGLDGVAEGPGARGLKPPPAHLGWLSKIPPDRRDGFMYWSVAEGGVQLRTDMPAFKGEMTDDEIWSVIGYIQARLPAAGAR